jgi:serine/threonine protein kinase
MTALAAAPMQIASAVKVERGDGYMVGVLAPRARFEGDALEVPWNGRIRHQATAVALKVLPDEFATEPSRLARFQREAQVLASLNHPNLIT